MRINLLLCDTFPGLLPSYIQSYAEMFANLFKTADTGIETRVCYPFLGELPDTGDTKSIYLITGCNQSAYDNTPWIVTLGEWIRKAYTNKCKLVGICFGHQLIAHALGGKVVKAKQGWGTGIRESTIIDEYSANLFGDRQLSLLYNHHDQVVELPHNAIRIATSDFCINEAFRIGTQVITFQGHPEYTLPYAEHLLRNHSAGENAQTIEAALSSLKTKVHKGSGVAQWILTMMDY